MRWLTLALLLLAGPASAQCLAPRCSGNVSGTVLMLGTGPRVRLAGAQGTGGVIDSRTAYLAWDFDPTETAQDATSATPKLLVVTPTPADAAAMTYVLSNNYAGRVIVTGVTCTAVQCQTPPLAIAYPAVLKGGPFMLRVSREKLPQFHESVASEPGVMFTTVVDGGPPPPPVICMAGTFREWSLWAPIPLTSPPREERHRDRDILNRPCVGTPNLLEVETRPILITPPVKTCTYMAPASTVFQTRNVGDVVEGNNYSPQGRGQRMDQLMAWGFKVEGFALDKDSAAVHIKATCVGLP